MKNLSRILICVIILTLFASIIFALKIKLGSLAPMGTPWDTSLKKMAGEWKKISKGKIKLKIYPGGIAGDEDDMIRKIRIGQLDAAGLTGVGLSRIFKGVFAIQMPFVVRDDKELDYLLEKMMPYYEKKMAEKGFKVLHWSKSGWAYFYSRRPIKSPNDLRKQKLFIWEGDADLTKAWKDYKFQPVPLSATELMTSLQSGMVDAIMVNPLVAGASQYFGIAKNMCDMKVTPFLGAIVISTKVWKKIKPKLKPELQKSASIICTKMDKDVVKSNKDTMKIMKKYGLKVHKVSKANRRKWEKLFDEGRQRLVGTTVHKESYDMIKKFLKEYRK